MEKAFAYLRVSSQNQIDGDGYERQRDAIVRYCRINGLTVVGWYREQETGTVQERPELARLMVDLESNGNGIKTVIIERLDRLARDLMVQEAIIQDFRRHRIELISAAEGPDLASGDPARNLIRQVLGAVAEYDKTMLVLKLRAARQRKRIKTGKCEGAKRYGEDSEEEQAIIRKIRAMRRNKRGGRKGATLQEIADRLNAEGIPTKRGKKWAPAQVYYILRYRKAKVKGRIQKSARIKVGS